MKLSLLFVATVGLVGTCLQAASDQMVYVGTYTNGKNPRVESKVGSPGTELEFAL